MNSADLQSAIFTAIETALKEASDTEGRAKVPRYAFRLGGSLTAPLTAPIEALANAIAKGVAEAVVTYLQDNATVTIASGAALDLEQGDLEGALDPPITSASTELKCSQLTLNATTTADLTGRLS